MPESVNCKLCRSTIARGSSSCGSCGATVEDNKPPVLADSGTTESQNSSDLTKQNKHLSHENDKQNWSHVCCNN